MEIKEKQVYVAEDKTYLGLPVHMKILAIKEGYVMYRHKGAFPDVLAEKDMIDYINKNELKLNNMNFNQEYINKLAEGDIILQHTKLPQDLPLLRAILKQAFPNDTQPFMGGMDYYLAIRNNTSYWQNYSIIHSGLQHLPIIPLHDFVSPTKEEKATIESIDARLKELEEIIATDREAILSIINKIKAKEEQPKEELLVTIRGDQHGNHNFIQVSNGLGGFTKEEAEKYQAIIKNALNT